MNQVRLLIRDAQREIHKICSDHFGDCVMAALSAEPETIEELDAALGRFIPATEWNFFRDCEEGCCDQPHDEGLVILDLAARLLVDTTSDALMEHAGCVLYEPGPHRHSGEPPVSAAEQLNKATGNAPVDKEDDESADESPADDPLGDDPMAEDDWMARIPVFDRRDEPPYLGYHLPQDWQLLASADGWRALAEQRRKARAAQPPLDARAVLYGKPALEFIARECLAACRQLPEFLADVEVEVPQWRRNNDDAAGPPEMETQASEPAHAAVREIHVRWMMTPRNDLRGQTPREAMLSKRDFIAWDLQDRENQWSRLGTCPRGLDEDAHAYRYGGFGTHEFVEYYYLFRHLLWSCREGLAEVSRGAEPSQRPDALAPGDFLTGEVPRLEQMREAWLDTPDPEFHGRTPRSIIEHERARLPEGMSGKDAVIDHDCPLCAMQADLPGPMFWHLDGCNMDDDFAFDYFCGTREEWDEKQREYEDFNRKFNEKWVTQKALGVENPENSYSDPDYAWQRSFVAKDATTLPLPIRLFAVGSRLSELIVDLKEGSEDRTLVEALMRDFANLREVAGATAAPGSVDLIEPVLARFGETLGEVAAAREDLQEKCDDLREKLGRFLELPRVEEPKSGSADEDGWDGDIPF